LTKIGDGTLILAAGTNTNGTSTYTGPTSVNDGALIVDGAISGSTIAVNTGGTLGGGGTVTAVNLSSGGNLAPGNGGIGTLTAANVTFASGSAFTLEINSSLVGGTDRLAASGTVNLASASLSAFDLGAATLSGGQVFNFITATSVVGQFAGLPDLAFLTIGANSYQIDYTSSSVSLIAVPEPGSALLFAGAFGTLLGLRRRPNRASK
jgi:hypothetical protein